MSYKIGDIVTGRVTGIQPYGAFITLEDNTQGLIHVSEIQSGYTKNIAEKLALHQEIRAKIIDIDDYSKKISLSLRVLEKYPVNPPFHKKKYSTNKNKKIGFQTIENSLDEWIKVALEDLTNHDD
ncbi:general stress protein 13 [Pilibacter termitis]|uniref:General stress protein 13 n=1 Tax=Pilibacter termitis TaxID=263852 RepID=A0A1T4R5E7_9ENTE|nr:CvfD/Ygs/GSP13 family RNA-binding post-transcriptional regulator [Pilibacter termitis]SKA11262.1 general stress protein 13 [Pilibacter termitis]